MKKFLVIVLTCLLALGSFTAIIAYAATSGETAQPQAATNSVYLVPGSYVNGSNKINNTISTNANVKRLSASECAAIFTDNAYLCTLAEGETLPTPASNRKDKEGNPYKFNGWWAIVDATVTYFTKVPSASVAPFLYADWRADLSQRMDPVEPDEEVDTSKVHYLEITHADKTVEQVKLYAGSTDQTNAESLGYNGPQQLYNIDLVLQPGDVIKVYTTGLVASEDAQVAPVYKDNSTRTITLETSGLNGNATSSFLSKEEPASRRLDPYMTYIASAEGRFDIYIKFFSGGSMMAVYMEPTRS